MNAFCTVSKERWKRAGPNPSSRNLFSERSVFTSALRCLMSQSDSTNSVSFCYTTSNTSVFITNKWLLHYLLLCINSSTQLILMTNALYLYYFYNIASCLPSLTGEMHEATIPVTLQSLATICSYFLPIVFRRSHSHSHSHVLVNLHPPLWLSRAVASWTLATSDSELNSTPIKFSHWLLHLDKPVIDCNLATDNPPLHTASAIPLINFICSYRWHHTARNSSSSELFIVLCVSLYCNWSFVVRN